MVGMVDEPAATRREVDVMRERMGRLESRIDVIDREGTRGMAAVLLQVTETNKDVAELRADVTGWQRGHEHLHEQEQKDRRTARRWLIGIGIAGIASMGGLYPWVALIMAHH